MGDAHPGDLVDPALDDGVGTLAVEFGGIGRCPIGDEPPGEFATHPGEHVDTLRQRRGEQCGCSGGELDAGVGVEALHGVGHGVEVATGDATLLERPLERIGAVGRPIAGRVGTGRVGSSPGPGPAEFVEHVGSRLDLRGLSVRAVTRAFQHRHRRVASTVVGELS